MLPAILKDFNVFVDGNGMAGRAKNIKLPKLERQMEEWCAAGMAGPIEIDLGQASLKLEFTLGGFVVEVLRRWGVNNPSGIGLRLLGAEVTGDGGRTNAIEVSVRGRWKSLDWGDVERKKLNELKIEMPLTYYRYSINKNVIHEIDMIGGNVIVNGTNLSAKILSALSIAN
jgi:uncharacterized protein